MRIYILGQSGSGKTTFASALSKKLNTPHIELDTIWHKYDGDRERFKKEVFEKVQTKDWVADGKHKTVRKELMEMADLIIYSDFSLGRSVINNIKRGAKYNEPPFKFLGHLLKVIREFYPTKTKIGLELNAHSGKTKVLRSFKEIDQFLQSYGE